MLVLHRLYQCTTVSLPTFHLKFLSHGCSWHCMSTCNVSNTMSQLYILHDMNACFIFCLDKWLLIYNFQLTLDLTSYTSVAVSKGSYSTELMNQCWENKQWILAATTCTHNIYKEQMVIYMPSLQDHHRDRILFSQQVKECCIGRYNKVPLHKPQLAIIVHMLSYSRRR